jgi:hypothetical protein
MSVEKTDKSENKTGPAGKIAKSGHEIVEQATEIHRNAAYAGLSMTSKLRGKGDNFLDSLIDAVETVQVSALEAIDKSQDEIGKSVDKIAKAIDESLDIVEEETSAIAREAGLPSPAQPLMESANRVAAVVEGAQKSVTKVTNTLLGGEDEKSKEWNDDDLADW